MRIIKYECQCDFCRDKGRVGGCPKCGKELDILARDELKAEPIEDIEKLGIPEHYLNNEWNADILYNDHDDYIDDSDFMRYVAQLNKLYEHLKNGGVVKNSALVSTPIGYGKTTWVYNCILQLVKHGYKVPPLISTSKIKVMSTLAQERPTWRNEYMGYSYNTIIESDVLFMSVTKSLEYVYAPRQIIEIVDMRANMVKPTLIISDWSARSLLKVEETGMLESMLRGGTNVDPNKYLIRIEFLPYKNKK